MKMIIRRLFSDNPKFYKIYFHLYRKHRGITPPFFSSDTELYFDGYPRSGNTFLAKILKTNFPNIKTVHHLHKVAPIKIALKLSLPSLILIRNPSECISSNYLKHFSLTKKIPNSVDISLLKKMVDDYIRYYSYVKKVEEQVYIIQFRKLINDTELITKSIRDYLRIQISDKEVENLTKTAIQNYKGATDKYGSSKPNKFKEQEKEKIKIHFNDLDRYKESFDLYEQLSL